MIGIVGAGAFGLALAAALQREGQVVRVWARDPSRVPARRAAEAWPGPLDLTGDIVALGEAEITLICVPMQQLGGFLARYASRLGGLPVACCKGIDVVTGLGATALIAEACPGSTPAVLTGPGFASEIAKGQPTALALACRDSAVALRLQTTLSTRTLRLYRTSDVTGAELGGALKNVVAIAAGVAIGADLGESARAAIVTRGHAEMVALAVALGAKVETLAGLSGLGDLILTATSPQSRNFRFGEFLGNGKVPDMLGTVEGVATSGAAHSIALREGLDLPLLASVAALVAGSCSPAEAIEALLSRPLKPERPCA